MGASAIGGLSVQSGGLSFGSSESDIRKTIDRLERRREDYEKQKELSDSSLLDKKISDIEKRIENLQARLDRIKSEEDDGECETCKNRKYQDGSDDPGVSFKMASKVGPEGAESAVRGHENEHVTRNQAKAAREGREIVYQSVTIKRAICPECGRSYVSGGETKTVTRGKRFDAGLPGGEYEKGKVLDMTA